MVADELQRYIEEGLLEEAEYTNDFSLTRYWQVSTRSSLHSVFFHGEHLGCLCQHLLPYHHYLQALLIAHYAHPPR
jgi:hypothetical protein